MRYAGRRVEWISFGKRSTATVIRKEGNWLRVSLDLKNELKGETVDLLIQPYRVRFLDEKAQVST